MKTYTVYQLTVERVPGIYIGITCMRLSQRLASHKADIKHGKNNARVNWLRQAQEHGHDIHIRPILTGLTKQDAEQVEEELIALHRLWTGTSRTLTQVADPTGPQPIPQRPARKPASQSRRPTAGRGKSPVHWASRSRLRT